MLLTIVQCWRGRGELLEASAPVHEAYAMALGARLLVSHDPLADPLPHWFDKLVLMGRAMDEMDDGDLAVSIDADALVVGQEAFPRPAAPFGLARNRWGEFNMGVIVARRCDRARRAVEECLRLGPVYGQEASLGEHVRFHQVARDDVEEMDSRFNCWPGQASQPTGPVVVRAWHGCGERSALCEMRSMAAAIGGGNRGRRPGGGRGRERQIGLVGE